MVSNKSKVEHPNHEGSFQEFIYSDIHKDGTGKKTSKLLVFFFLFFVDVFSSFFFIFFFIFFFFYTDVILGTY